MGKRDPLPTLNLMLLEAGIVLITIGSTCAFHDEFVVHVPSLTKGDTMMSNPLSSNQIPVAAEKERCVCELFFFSCSLVLRF